jgi:hypothetical protein
MTFWNAYISGMLARRLRSLYSNRRILGSLKTRSCRPRVSKMKGKAAGRAPTKMEEATYGVWFPVPKKSAVRGYTILSPKSLDSPNRRKSTYMGSSASRPSRSLTVFRTRPNLLMSGARRSVRGEGKTLVQKFWPLPKLILSRQRKGGEGKRNMRREKHGRRYGTRTACLLFRGDIRVRGRCAACLRRRESSPGHRR